MPESIDALWRQALDAPTPKARVEPRLRDAREARRQARARDDWQREGLRRLMRHDMDGLASWLARHPDWSFQTAPMQLLPPPLPDAGVLELALEGGHIDWVSQQWAQGSPVEEATFRALTRSGNPEALHVLMAHHRAQESNGSERFAFDLRPLVDECRAQGNPPLLQALFAYPEARGQLAIPSIHHLRLDEETAFFSTLARMPALAQQLNAQWGIDATRPTGFLQKQGPRRDQNHTIVESIWQEAIVHDDVPLAKALVRQGWAPMTVAVHPEAEFSPDRDTAWKEGLMARLVQHQAFDLLAWCHQVPAWKAAFEADCRKYPALWWSTPPKERRHGTVDLSNIQTEKAYWTQLHRMGVDLATPDASGNTALHHLARAWGRNRQVSFGDESCQWWAQHALPAWMHANKKGETPVDAITQGKSKDQAVQMQAEWQAWVMSHTIAQSIEKTPAVGRKQPKRPRL